MPRATPSRAAPPTPSSTSTSTSCRSAPTTTPCSTCSTRTPARTTSRATPRHPASTAPTSHPSCSRTRRSRRCSARSRSSRAWSASPPRCASRTASRATSRSSPASTTAGTTTAESSRSATTRRGRAPHAPVAQRRDRSGAAQRPRPARRVRPGADVAMSAGDAQPTVPTPEWAPGPARRAPAAARLAVDLDRRHRGRARRRGVVRRRVDRPQRRREHDPRSRSSRSLALPADQPVEVECARVRSSRSCIAGELDEVTISSEDVPIGSVAGDVTVAAQGHPIRGGARQRDAATVVRSTRPQLRDAAWRRSTASRPTSLGLDEPDVTMSTELRSPRRRLPRRRRPDALSAAEGDIVLTPATLQLAGADDLGRRAPRSVRPARGRRAARLDRVHRRSTSRPGSP